MPTLEREPTVTPQLPDESDTSATALAVILVLVLVGVIGYALYSFNYALRPPVSESSNAQALPNQPAPYAPYAQYTPPSRPFP